MTRPARPFATLDPRTVTGPVGPLRSLCAAVLLSMWGACGSTGDGTPDAGGPNGGTDAGAPVDAGNGGATDAGETNETPDGGGTPGLTGSFAGNVVDALCDYAARCPLNELGRFDVAQDCREALIRRGPVAGTDFNTWYAVEREELNDRLQVDDAKALSCLAAIAASSCDRRIGAGSLRHIPDCAAAVTGLIADGATCGADLACASGFCRPGTGCAGTCVAPISAGSPCDGDCGPGLFCAAKFDGNKVCQPLGTLGEECGPCEPGLVCEREAVGQPYRCVEPPATAEATCRAGCTNGLTCVDANPPATCVAAPGNGEPCSFLPTQCATGTTCDFLASPPTCRTYPTAGQPCLSTGECDEASYCAPGENQAICAPTDGTQGAPCGREDNCNTGLTCFNGACTALPVTGPCLDFRCAEGSICFDDVCSVLPTDGQPCFNPIPGFGACATGTTCDTGGTCRANQSGPAPTIAEIGERCDGGATCRDGANCVTPTPNPASITCRALPRNGQACDAGRCAPGLACSNGTCAFPPSPTGCGQ